MSDLPLLFYNPPGWPVPSDGWIASHLGWTPPAGWRPTASAPHIPQFWTFWSRNPSAWAELARPLRGKVTMWLWISIAAGFLALILTLAGASSGGGYVVFWGAILWPVVNLIRYPFRLRAINDSLMAHITSTSLELRGHLEDVMYAEHINGRSS